MIAKLSVDKLQELARFCCRTGGYVSLKDIVTTEAEVRLGPRHDLGLDSTAFDVVLSVSVPDSDHINVEEARALMLFAKWVLRMPHRFNRRRVVCIDSPWRRHGRTTPWLPQLCGLQWQ